MKTSFIITAALVFAVSAMPLYGQSTDSTSGLEENKAKKLHNINNRIAVLEAERDCIKLAKDEAELKKCKAESLNKRRDLAIDSQKQKK
ncbi:MAG: hypothetical protein LLF86_02760 [Nitrospiraceae bacterium]|nr:hypothetical protein [Nitrospiraceae bacterium]